MLQANGYRMKPAGIRSLAAVTADFFMPAIICSPISEMFAASFWSDAALKVTCIGLQPLIGNRLMSHLIVLPWLPRFCEGVFRQARRSAITRS